MQAFLEEAKKSSRTIANLSTAVKNRVLNEMADALMNHCDFIISNNEKDMSQATLYNLVHSLHQFFNLSLVSLDLVKLINGNSLLHFLHFFILI